MRNDEGTPEAVSGKSYLALQRVVDAILLGRKLAAEGMPIEEAQWKEPNPELRVFVKWGWKSIKHDSLEAQVKSLMEMAMIDKGVRSRDV